MELLSKAKDYLARKASKLAMAGVLAVLAVAVPAKATPVTLDPNGTDTCELFLTGNCNISTNPTGGNPFMNQVVLTGTATPGIGTAAELDVFFGTISGGPLPAGTIPVSWDFTISGLASGSVQWAVAFGLYSRGINGFDGFNGFSADGTTGNGEVTGNGLINIGAGEDLSGYSIELTAFSSSGSFTLSAPLTLNSAVPSAEPEPGSLLLMGVGGSALLLLKRRKKQA